MRTASLLAIATIIFIILLAQASNDISEPETQHAILIDNDSINQAKLQIYVPEQYLLDAEDNQDTLEIVQKKNQFSPTHELAFITDVNLPEIVVPEEAVSSEDIQDYDYQFLDWIRDREAATEVDVTIESEETVDSNEEAESNENEGSNTEEIAVAEVESLTENTANKNMTVAIQNNSPADTASSSLNVDALIQEAKQHEGTPFVFGGSAPGGFDCSGFIYYVLNQIGYKIDRLASDGYYEATELVEDPQAGDLIFFAGTYRSGISHLGIVINDNQFIHAGSRGVEISSLDVDYWQEHFAGYRRLVQ
ncbi:C40 family peptidase [Radiobacillus sp. PE A8.2]|uniref:C40 family peptidase n=1 Tax=Radiobacillus sp. PE A8.2 TaxID=3380349 RepID=UPI00388EFD3A